MKRPLLALAFSVGAVIIGSAVCLPGICGCVSWLGIPDADRFGLPFILLTFAGILGIAASLCWMLVSAIVTALSKVR
jgi:hypothetical protein